MVADDVEFESVMRKLTSYCFLETRMPPETWSMHPYVHDWTLASLNTVIDRQQYWYSLDCVAASIDENDWEVLGNLKYARLSSHALWLVHDRFHSRLGDWINFDRSGEAHKIAELLTKQVQLVAAEQIYRRALAEREKVLRVGHFSTLNTIQHLGILFLKQDKLDEAKQMCQRALAGYEQALGAHHILTLNTIDDLGVVFMKQGKLGEAEQMYQRALAGKEKALGVNHTLSLNTVHNLGTLYRWQHKLDKAEQMYRRALTGYEKALGVNHTWIPDTVHNLGYLYTEKGKLNDAEQLYQRALARREKALGADYISTINTVKNLCLVLVSLAYEAQSQSRSTESNLPQQLNRLLQLTYVWGSQLPSLYGYLGRVLLWTLDEGNAMTAFQQQNALHGETYIYVNTWCDGCDLPISYDMKRYVCKDCLDIDLCGQCFSSHGTGEKVIATCVNHRFSKTTPPDEISESGFTVLDETSRASWLRKLMTPETWAIVANRWHSRGSLTRE